MEDSKIVDLYLARDESAITSSADKYGQKLLRIANNILDNWQTAEECENDTYFEAWKLIPPHEPRTYLFAFLAKIIRNLALDQCRKNNSLKRKAIYNQLTREMEECIPSSSDTAKEVAGNQLEETINSFLRNCSDDSRNIFVRRYYFFDSIDEIANRYGYGKSKVKVSLLRTREALRKHLEKEGYLL